MRGIISKIDLPRQASDKKNVYYRIDFKMDPDGRWAHTDVVPTFHNYLYWKSALESGPNTILDGLRYVFGSKVKINADSRVIIVGKLTEQPGLFKN